MRQQLVGRNRRTYSHFEWKGDMIRDGTHEKNQKIMECCAVSLLPSTFAHMQVDWELRRAPHPLPLLPPFALTRMPWSRIFWPLSPLSKRVVLWMSTSNVSEMGFATGSFRSISENRFSPFRGTHQKNVREKRGVHLSQLTHYSANCWRVLRK